MQTTKMLLTGLSAICSGTWTTADPGHVAPPDNPGGVEAIGELGPFGITANGFYYFSFPFRQFFRNTTGSAISLTINGTINVIYDTTFWVQTFQYWHPNTFFGIYETNNGNFFSPSYYKYPLIWTATVNDGSWATHSFELWVPENLSHCFADKIEDTANVPESVAVGDVISDLPALVNAHGDGFTLSDFAVTNVVRQEDNGGNDPQYLAIPDAVTLDADNKVRVADTSYFIKTSADWEDSKIYLYYTCQNEFGIRPPTPSSLEITIT